MEKLIVQLFILCSFSSLMSQATDQYFWHMTDIHVDPTYHSTKESCESDVTNTGKFGNHGCDSPYELMTSSIKAMLNHGRVPTFIIYTGDSPPHLNNGSTLELNTENVIAIMRNITTALNNTFSTTPIIMSLGNHDYHPTDQLPAGVPDPLYDEMAEMWSHWLTPEAKDTFKIGAYYTMLLNHTGTFKLRVVVINTNLYLTSNMATAGDQDPGGQFTWLQNVLEAARTEQEKVHLVGHVPNGVMPAPDMPMWMRDADNTRLNGIIRDFADIILGYYSSHDHLDGFRVFYKDDEPVTALYIAPSVAPKKRGGLPEDSYAPAHNPGVRKIIYDEFNGFLRDIEQYYLDLPTANQDKHDVWKRLYTFRGIYGLQNVTAPALHELIERFGEFGNPDFHSYYDMSTVGSRDSSVEPCSCDCKEMHICTMQNVDYSDFTDCYETERVTCGSVTSQVSLTLMSALVLAAVWFKKAT